MGGLGGQEIIIIAVIIAILFGVKKLPSIGKNLGEGIREFRKAGKELVHEDEDDD